MCHMTSDHAHLQVGPADQAGEVVERVSDRLSSSSAQLWVVNYSGKGQYCSHTLRGDYSVWR